MNFNAEISRIYAPCDIGDVLKLALTEKDICGNRKGEKFYNAPCAFDIETTSFYRDATTGEQVKEYGPNVERCAAMYIWQFGVNGYCIIGRTWKEFEEMCDTLCRVLNLSDKRRLIVYVHNLSYEFQFIRKRFTWLRVFSGDVRKPIYAITDGGIEFRCSYYLSGYSLDTLGKQLRKYKVLKKSGDLDYALARNCETPLTDEEIGYCVNDIRVVMAYIAEKIEEAGRITNLPLTRTGYVRKYCRKHCLRTDAEISGKSMQNWPYVRLMKELRITDLREFSMLQRAFAGGFTHANAVHSCEVMYNVGSYDFTSSYPFVMVSEKFPMGQGVRIDITSDEQFRELADKYCCIFDIEFNGIYATQIQDNPISASKCFIKENAVENNGRIVAAKRLAMTITDVDYAVLSNFYKWDSKRIGILYAYRKDYLPTDFIKAVLTLYSKKTELKGVDGKEAEYLNSKEMLNSCYGMCVTNPLRDEITYGDDWGEKRLGESERLEQLMKHNDSMNRFLFYPWGVFVTAYARRNLFTGIWLCGDDYVYSDTDSIKLTDCEKHAAYFYEYNRAVEIKLRKACEHHRIPFEMCCPKTIEGKTKMLGVWDFEGVYTRFKTLGAKRYMTEKDGEVSLTVSGVNKKAAIPYLKEMYGDDIFKAFSDYLEIPPQATGKNIHTYIDYEIEGDLTDYKGHTARFDEKTAVHLEEAGYTMNLSVMYLNYLRGIKFKD